MSELSGLVATASGYIAINDSQTEPSRMKIFTLDSGCKVVGTPFSLVNPNALDPEDLGVDKNGTVWLADIGDNTKSRKTVAVRSWTPGARESTIHRLTYPDGKARDAETLLINGDGTPIIVTKEPAGEVYVPDGELVPRTETGVKMKKVGTFKTQKTGTPNPLQFLGEAVITGGAVSPDGTKAIVRTMSDAYEFDVTNGDVVKAITTGTPRITPLPNESQGEAITYSADGTSYVTVSDAESTKTTLLRYAPANVKPVKASGPAVPSPKGDERSFFAKLSLQEITYIVASVGVLGLLLVLIGIVGIRRSRARRRAAAAAGPVRARATVAPPDDYGNDRDGYNRANPPGGPGSIGATGTVYGGGQQSGRVNGGEPNGRGAVYGAPSAGYDDFDRADYNQADYNRGGYEPAGYPPRDHPSEYDGGYGQDYGRRR